jgi:hypothetical protein
MMFGCEWYPKLLKNNIPTINTKIVEIKSWDEFDMTNKSNAELFPCFMRFCNASPKDCCNGIFEKPSKKIIECFKSSSRTWFMLENEETHPCHIMYRDVIYIDYEFRCFWYKGFLTAVSGPSIYVDEDIQQSIIDSVTDFFDLHGANIPFDTVVFDMCYNDGFPFVIECNNFEASGLELFHPDEKHLIYNDDPDECVYKFKKLYEF